MKVEQKDHISIPQTLGAATLVIGGLLVGVPRRRRSETA